jgi:hypothetical protein
VNGGAIEEEVGTVTDGLGGVEVTLGAASRAGDEDMPLQRSAEGIKFKRFRSVTKQERVHSRNLEMVGFQKLDQN